MRVYFEKRKEGGYFTHANSLSSRLDIDVIKAFPHKFLPNGYGYVDLPIFITDGIVKLVGAEYDNSHDPLNVPEAKTDTKPHVQLPANLSNSFMEPYIGDTLPPKNPEVEKYKRKLEDAAFEQKSMDKGLAEIIKPLTVKEDKEIFITQAEADARKILGEMGLTEYCKGRWYHPAFGDRQMFDYIWFDPATDSIPSLLVKIFNHGKRGMRIKFRHSMRDLGI